MWLLVSCSARRARSARSSAKLAGIALVFEHAELVARGGNAVQAQDLDRVGRLGGIDMIAARVDQRTNAAVGRAGDHDVARYAAYRAARAP